MARSRSPFSPSPELSPPSSPPLSDSSIEDLAAIESYYDGEASISHPASPSYTEFSTLEPELESVICLWESCGRPFSYLPSLIDHIHNEHIGVNRSNYTCEWANCGRRGAQQASRFALISHIRQHTGEKPFVCRLPECDKSFTRSDAMAKHMRLQHNIVPEVHGRGGNRKRKREEPEPEEATAPGYNTFKVEDSNTPTEYPPSVWDPEDGRTPPIDERRDYSSGRRSASPGAMSVESMDEREEDAIPEHLMQAMDPQTGLIYGQTPAMVRYLIIAAKHQYALEQHEHLLEELRIVRNEEKRMKEAKEEALDHFLRVQFGPEADFLIAQPNLEQARRHAAASEGPHLAVRVDDDGIEHDL